MNKTIYDAATGETTVVDLTSEEVAALEADRLRIQQLKDAEAAKKEAALAKLAALGLEPDDLKALGL